MWWRTNPIPFRDDTRLLPQSEFLYHLQHNIQSPEAIPTEHLDGNYEYSLDGKLTVLNNITRHCEFNTSDESNDTFSYTSSSIVLPEYMTVSHTHNRLTIVGCDISGYLSSVRLNQSYLSGCRTTCDNSSKPVASGFSCQTNIPEQARDVELFLLTNDEDNINANNSCGYAYVTEPSAITENITKLRDTEKLPMVVDWAIGNGTCEEDKKDLTSYACRSRNSECYMLGNDTNGYRCKCSKGYEGNPYKLDGCQDINECQNKSMYCEKECENTVGSYRCLCPSGYHGDGKKDGKGCIPSESLIFRIASGIAVGVTLLLLASCWLHLELKRKRLIKMRQEFYIQNGGIMLQEKLYGTGGPSSSSDAIKIFSEHELKKATDNFSSSMIIGQGGYGTVYKGILPEKRIVAIKKSKVEIDPSRVDQFANEVLVLSQINHRNVVKLLGCCLERQQPLLVYEYMNNGTLFQHIHNKERARALSWDVRLKIATETAGVLSYLHSSASTPIIHRDVKSANILLDQTFTAKVSDFGASKLVPLDHTQLSTMVQGTIGYLDPEYMQTNQLTEKSDVYSFGVVLVELLTGMKALSYERPEEEMNLAHYFLSVMRQKLLFQIVADDVVTEGGNNEEQVMEVAELARICLNVRGDDRPSMKEVAAELEGLSKIGGKHLWVEPKGEDAAESLLLGDGLSESSYTGSVRFDDSVEDHMVMGGGR
ncbi:Wall-associated receptor kinase 5 [Striga hermonthica]|uniref:Wall-associated receptor kinase 5 n=1 Tax=Striga hermonthica TaxID=68872 RepID=A0A9N7MJ93_STRHE|nr:Wall-associated receptor kinase 5 [Striga hermonthica]